MSEEKIDRILKQLEKRQIMESAMFMTIGWYELRTQALLEEILEQVMQQKGHSRGVEKIELELALQRVHDAVEARHTEVAPLLSKFHQSLKKSPEPLPTEPNMPSEPGIAPKV